MDRRQLQAKRSRRHSFSSLEESAREMEAEGVALLVEEGRKRCSSPSLSEGSSPKRSATGTRAAASSSSAGISDRMADLACLPLGE